jgi:REP element-mobilizing transposase RayT
MPHGNPHRLPGFDYSGPGWYFVTVVTEGRRAIFGGLEAAEIRPSPIGVLAVEMFEETLRLRPWISSKAFVAMPDHVHALIGWDRIPSNRRDITLGHFVSQFKGLTTREARKRGFMRSWERLWQDGFWEVVVGSPHQLERCQGYITANPERACRPRDRHAASDGPTGPTIAAPQAAGLRAP